MHKKGIISTVVFLTLIVPNKFFEIYYGLIGLLFLFIGLRHFRLNKIHLIIFTYAAILLTTRTVLWNSISDLKELVKITFMLISLLFLKGFKEILKTKYVYYSIGFFSILNFVVSVILVFQLSSVLESLILQFYTAESQRILYTFSSIRSTGLSSGVGQQGLLSLMSLVYFVESSKQNRFRIFFISIIFVTLLVSQSKTSIAIGLLYLLYVLRKNLIVLTLGVSSIIFLVTKYFDLFKSFFREIFHMFSGGELSSLDGRISNWVKLLIPMIENPLSLFIGLGRGYFESSGITSSVYDSDFIYIIVNFGLIGLIFYLLYILNIMSKLIWERKVALLLILCSGFTLNPVFEPKLFIVFNILTLTFSQSSNEKKYLGTCKLP